MAIILQPGRHLSNNQWIQLYSNPVSGIVFNSLPNCMELPARQRLWKIRYSKSMILKALEFWHWYFYNNYLKMKRVYNPLKNYSDIVWRDMDDIAVVYLMIKDEYPDTFLFSHRHIKPGNFKDYIDDTPCALLKKKYPIIKKDQPLWIQEGKRDIFFDIHLRDLGISFTVFPNEHPYIPRQKISRVGMTEKGNVFVMMAKDGARRK